MKQSWNHGIMEMCTHIFEILLPGLNFIMIFLQNLDGYINLPNPWLLKRKYILNMFNIIIFISCVTLIVWTFSFSLWYNVSKILQNSLCILNNFQNVNSHCLTFLHMEFSEDLSLVTIQDCKLISFRLS